MKSRTSSYILVIGSVFVALVLVSAILLSSLSHRHGNRTKDAHAVVDRSLMEHHCATLLKSSEGIAPISEVIEALANATSGPEVQWLYQILSLRKQEALMLVREKLRTGDVFEKHALTKFLRYCPWPEAQPELVELAQLHTENWLPRQCALFALGVLGDPSAGPAVVKILDDQANPSAVRLVAISALARMGYREAIPSIRTILEDDDVRLRLFAVRALNELGDSVNPAFLQSLLQHEDYTIRAEAAEALAATRAKGVPTILLQMAEKDSHQAVRESAWKAYLKNQFIGKTALEQIALLKSQLGSRGKHIDGWIIETLYDRCGDEGRDLVRELGKRDGRIGERARFHLVMRGEFRQNQY